MTFVLPPGAFRLLLAAAVVFSHLTDFDVGRLAVQIFFFLSGYWTARIWAEKFGGHATGRFYAARYLRIAPLYFLVMLVAAGVARYPLHIEDLTLLGVASTLHDPTHVAWSLDIELQFYLLAPLVAVVFSRSRAAPVLAVAVALAVAGFALYGRTGAATVLMYLPAFAMGALTHSKAWKPSEGAAALSLAAFALASAVTAFTPFMLKSVADPFDRDIYGAVWMLPLVPYVARSLSVKAGRLDRHLGNLSFPLYLVHLPVLVALRPLIGHSMAARTLIAATAVALALLIYRTVDRPVDRWRVRLTERPTVA